ncbi:MAG: hydrogen gas-evolving membrane-bound hydrogenase subunit E, partial [Acidimicrobiales bacterium]
ARALAAAAPSRGGPEAFAATVRGLNTVARRLTGVVQNGSLPVYSAVILLTAAAVPAVALATGAAWPGLPPLAESPAQVVLAAMIITAAVTATVMTRRFAAVLLLGAVGYGMGLVFVVQGAPDLALTQFSVETLSVVAFVLVLRFLPPRFERRRPAIAAHLRVFIAAAVAVVVFGLAITASAGRPVAATSRGIVERSLPEGGGRNVVNVVLVDFRGLDTLGEVSVLAVAGIGVVALARLGRVPRRPARRPGKARP